MAAGRNDPAVYWFSPDPRAVLPLDAFHVPRSLRRTLRQQRFEVRHDTAFEAVMRGCAAPRRGETETWINQTIIDAFVELHRLGYAHSIECWRDGRLMGGLYGLALGGAFFGESMFRDPATDRSTDASKVALVKTVSHLNHRGFQLFDVQFENPHLEQFGVIELPRDQYMERLGKALAHPTPWRD
jgi:leucyl/phenylalanyl-tRNA--protein transferase